jgi:DNA-binding transcriptional LysR family regulator
MQLKDVDLNLLRLFDAVYATRKVSRAAELLDITQPAASQGLTRLRTLMRDPLFMRSRGGVQPTPMAQRLADPVRHSLATLEQALGEATGFDPTASRRVFNIHMSDIGEGRFLPPLMAELRKRAPGLRVETRPVPRDEITEALDGGRIDFAFGFLPMVKDTERSQLLNDRYIVLLRKGHPFARKRLAGRALLAALQDLEFVAVRSHADTLRIVQQLGLQERVKLVTEHFTVLPAIVAATDLAAIMPRNIARDFPGGHAIVEPDFPKGEFTVSLHWSRRFGAEAGNRWFRSVVEELFRESR